LALALHDYGVIGSLLLAGVCGAAVFFMLIFLRALLKDRARPSDQSNALRVKVSDTSISVERNSRHFHRAA
jgi:hypothetical protein